MLCSPFVCALTSFRYIWWQFAVGFSLRGIQEQVELVRLDVKIMKDREGLEFLVLTPRVGKTYKGGIKDRKNNNGRYALVKCAR